MYLYIKGSVTFNHLLGLRNLKVCIALYLCAYLTFGGNDNKVLIGNHHRNHHYDDHHHELHLRNVVLLLHAVLPQTLFSQKLVPEKMFSHQQNPCIQFVWKKKNDSHIPITKQESDSTQKNRQ